MSTIASMSVQLNASPAGLIAGFAKARNATVQGGRGIEAAATRINAAINGIGSQIAGGNFGGAIRSSVDAAGSLATKLGAGASTAVGLGAAGKAAAVGIGAVAASVGSLVSGLEKVKSLFDEGAAKILEQRNAAITLGESFKETAALAMAAGGDVERMTRAMVHMNSTIQAARTGDSGAIAALSGKLGLNPEKLATMGTANRLEEIIRMLPTVRDELTKTSVELAIFGEKSATLFAPLLASANGLGRFREQFDRFGYGFGTKSAGEMKAIADQVLEAKRAVNQLSMAWEGVKMNLAAGLAPVLAKTAGLFSDLGVNAKQIQQWAVNGSRMLALGGAAVYESWKSLLNLWDRIHIGFSDMVDDMENVVLALAQRLQRLPEVIGGGSVKKLRELAGALMDLRVKMDVGANERRLKERQKERSAFDRVGDFYRAVEEDMQRKKKLADNAERSRSRYEPMRAQVQLSGAQEFGSQEAYKTLGTFAIGQKYSLAKEQLVQSQRIEEAIKKGDVTLKDIRNILKRHGVVKVRKI